MLVDQFDVFLLDLDGVVYVGDTLLSGVTEALASLRSRGRVVRFVTNDPRPSRKDVVHRLGRLGVRATVEEIVSSGWATACWLRQQGITRAYVVGSDGLRGELAAQGVESVEGSGAEAVVVGCDETVTYRDLAQATALLRTGVPFVATNVDATFPTASGPWPATGAVVAAIQTASGRRPVVVGKPGPEMFRLAQRGLPATTRVVVVGDTPATDVVGAHCAGLPAILVAPATPSSGRGQCDPTVAEATVTGLAGLFDPALDIGPMRPSPYPWPDEVRAGVAAVVFDEAGRVLLGRRLDNGLWGLPSGHVEVGETAAQAAVREVAPDARLRLHFHDTRNTGLANAAAAIDAGADVLDASCGGIGGCPFAPNATGNIATEDLVYMLERGGFSTGLDLDGLIETAEWIGARLGRPAPSALSRAGRFNAAAR